MATFGEKDLKAWRMAEGVTVGAMAEKVPCDVRTYFRYESGEINANPDVMYRICDILGDTRKWQDWMRTKYPNSYGREHPAPASYDLPGSLLSLYALVGQIDECKLKLFEDAADGEIDNDMLRGMIVTLTEKLISTAQAVRTLLPKGGEGDA